MDADKRLQVPYEHPHSDFQKLQTKQEEMRVTGPSVPPERAAPQAERDNMTYKKNVSKSNLLHEIKCAIFFVVCLLLKYNIRSFMYLHPTAYAFWIICS